MEHKCHFQLNRSFAPKQVRTFAVYVCQFCGCTVINSARGSYQPPRFQAPTRGLPIMGVYQAGESTYIMDDFGNLVDIRRGTPNAWWLTSAEITHDLMYGITYI